MKAYEKMRLECLLSKERKAMIMSMNKAIKSGKEHRKEYRDSKTFNKTCRNHGSCDWCRMNRQHKNLKKMQESIDKMLEEWYNNIKDKERIDGYDDKRTND